MALAVVGVWLLVGCIYIPTFGTRFSGKNVGKSVGAAGSDKPVRVKYSTRSDVLRVLGEPPFATADRRVFAYPWTVRNGIAVWPLCFATSAIRGQRTLVLRFDSNDVLGSFQTLKQNEPVVNLYYDQPLAPLLPEEIEKERSAARLREFQSGRASTRPATVPAAQPR